MSDEREIKFTARNTGMQFDAGKNLKGFAPKVPGKHRWIMMVSYNVTDENLRRAFIDREESHLDMENIADMGAACIDCEEIWPTKKKRCPARDFEEVYRNA